MTGRQKIYFLVLIRRRVLSFDTAWSFQVACWKCHSAVDSEKFRDNVSSTSLVQRRCWPRDAALQGVLAPSTEPLGER